MSWSVTAVGKAEAVAAKAEQEFLKLDGHLSGEEKELKDLAAQLVAKTIAAQAPGAAIKLEASGSAVIAAIPGESPVRFVQTNQSLNVSLQPIWGFVE
jgi:hypothetical protein